MTINRCRQAKQSLQDPLDVRRLEDVHAPGHMGYALERVVISYAGKDIQQVILHNQNHLLRWVAWWRQEVSDNSQLYMVELKICLLAQKQYFQMVRLQGLRMFQGVLLDQISDM